MGLASRFAASAARGAAALGVLAAVLLTAAAAAAAPTRVAGGIQFTYLDPNAKSVTWAGVYNGWNATTNPMTQGANGLWTVVVPLPPGEHQYKFVADGQWIADPENPVTGGEFGNSVVNVAANGDLVAMKATSNTAYSPKILVGGRIIGLYQAIYDEGTNRFGLRRPDMIVDLNLDIRISEVLKAFFLLNFESRAQDVEQYRGRLNFDRGSLDFTQSKFRLFAYDNMDAGTWDDPLHLVGDIGIYAYPYGYNRQGFRARADYLGFDSELHYADNFQTGGSTYPIPPPNDLSGTLPVTDDGSGGYVLVPGARSGSVNVLLSDANEDMLAFRARRKLGAGFSLGVLGRTDRGYNLGGVNVVETTGPNTFKAVVGNFEQEWFAAGGEARWKHPERDVWAEAGYLFGRTRAMLVPNGVGAYVVSADAVVDQTGIVSYTTTALTDASGEHFNLDGSTRIAVKAGGTFAEGDIGLRAGVEYQGHEYELLLDGYENTLTTWSAGWDRNWRYYLNREVKTTIDVDYFDFDYHEGTPWEYQLWFPTGNFWLEYGQHLVKYGRLTLLGGGDVISFAPSIEVPLLKSRNMTVAWHGNILGQDLTHRPKYAESIFRFGVDLTRNLRLNTDSRWVQYDDPVLELRDGYLSHFIEAAYDFGGGLSLALSTGVDPWVLDRTTNEYADIGRDQFLFGLGANGSVAETDYYSLMEAIPAAEKALRDERRIQIEAILKF